MEKVADTITRILRLADSKPFRRKAEICFLLSSKIAPFYQEYASHTNGLDEEFLNKEIVKIWKLYSGDLSIGRGTSLAMRNAVPDDGETSLFVYAQNALMCAIYLRDYIESHDGTDFHRCIEAYFDNVDYLVQERMNLNSGVSQLTEAAVGSSKFFRAEVNSFLSLLNTSDDIEIVSTSIISDNLRRKIS
jgi:hypothetical protein